MVIPYTLHCASISACSYFLLLPLTALLQFEHPEIREENIRGGMDMAAAKPSSATRPTTLPLAWRTAKLLISFVTHFVKASPAVNLFAFLLCAWKTRDLFVSAISFVAEAVKCPHEHPLPKPPLPWTTRLFVSLLSFLTDAVRRIDGPVSPFLSRMDVTVGTYANPARGVRTADVVVDPARGLWFRLFLPASRGRAGEKLPVVIFFHGGGFAFLSPATTAYDAACRRICRQVGFAVVCVNYRLSPEHRCPAAYNDGMDVLRFLESYPNNFPGLRHGGRPSAVNLLSLFFEVADLSSCFVAGDSAGANIAHHVARLWTNGEAPPARSRLRLAGLLAIQPFFGEERRVDSGVHLAGAPLVSTARTDWLWRAFLPEGANRDHEAANPAAAVAELGEAFPPTMVVVGGFDLLQDWQIRYYESLRKMGKKARLVEYPDAIHGFYVLPGLEASAAPLMEEMRRFVQKHALAVKENVHVE